MITSIFPRHLENVFKSNLGNLEGKSSFEKLKEYFNSITSAQSEEIRSFYTLDDRIERSTYFYLPNEALSNSDRNCFEKSADMYFAIKELYPQSDPQLIEVDEGNRGIHITCVFNHNGTLYGADPNYGIFDPVIIENGAIKRVKSDDELKEIKFKSLNIIKDNSLEAMIRNLRSDSGIVDFFRGSGQYVYHKRNHFRPFSIFMYLSDEEDTLISELRLSDFEPRLNSCYRRFRVPGRKLATKIQFSDFLHDNWKELENEFIILETKFGQTEQNYVDKFAKYIDLQSNSGISRVNRRTLMGIYGHYLAVINSEAKKNKTSRTKITFMGKRSLNNFKRDEIKDSKDFANFYRWGEENSEHFAQHLIDYMLFRSYALGNNFKNDNDNLSSREFFLKKFGLKDFINSYFAHKFLPCMHYHRYIMRTYENEVLKHMR